MRQSSIIIFRVNNRWWSMRKDSNLQLVNLKDRIMLVISQIFTLIDARRNTHTHTIADTFQQASVRPRFQYNRGSTFRNSRPWPLPKLASCVCAEFLCLDSFLSAFPAASLREKYSSRTLYRKTWNLARGHPRMGAHGNIFNETRVIWRYIIRAARVKPRDCENRQDYFRLI